MFKAVYVGCEDDKLVFSSLKDFFVDFDKVNDYQIRNGEKPWVLGVDVFIEEIEDDE